MGKHKASFSNLVNSYADEWTDLFKDPDKAKVWLSDQCQNEFFKNALRCKDTTEEHYRNKLKLAYVAVARCFPDADTKLLIHKYPDSTVLSALQLIDSALDYGLLNTDYTLPIGVNIAAAIAIDIAPKDPESAYPDVVKLLNLDPEILRVLQRSVEVIRPTLH